MDFSVLWVGQALLKIMMKLTAHVRESGGQTGAFGDINTWSQTGFCSDPKPFTRQRKAQSLFLKLLGLKSGFISGGTDLYCN